MEIKGNVVTISEVCVNTNLKTSLAAPIMVAFDITNRCNLKCVHCFNRSGENDNDVLSHEDRMNIVDQIIELNPYLVCLCGGETTCCSDLYQIIEKLSKKIPTINMVSNGYLIDKNTVKKLKEAKITNVQISLDGINSMQHDTFRGKLGSFEKAINAIKLLRYENIPVLTSFVPNKLNYLDTYNYFKLCNEIGVNSARCMPFLPMGRGGSIGDKLILNNKEYFIFKRLLNKAISDFPTLLIEWGDPIDHMYRQPENANYGMDSYCMEIKSNGDLGVSAYFPIYVGNCLKHTLKEYWDAGYNKIWKNKNIQERMKKIENIEDFRKFNDMEKYVIDLCEDKNEIYN